MPRLFLTSYEIKDNKKMPRLFLTSHEIKDNKKKCPEPESNQRHEDFQSSALPTELSGHLVCDMFTTNFIIAYRLFECKQKFKILRKKRKWWRYTLSGHKVYLFHILHIELFEYANGAGIFKAAFECKVMDFLLSEVKPQFM